MYYAYAQFNMVNDMFLREGMKPENRKQESDW